MEYLKQFPDEKGYFGEYGGSFVSDELQKEMDKMTDAYYSISKSHRVVRRPCIFVNVCRKYTAGVSILNAKI